MPQAHRPTIVQPRPIRDGAWRAGVKHSCFVGWADEAREPSDRVLEEEDTAPQLG